MNALQKAGFVALGTVSVFHQTFAAIDFGTSKAQDLSGGDVQDPEQTVIGLILLALSFVTLVAVIYVIYAGFQVLVGGSDDKAIGKAKSTIINVVLGIIIMWLAYAIVTWLITALGNA